MLILSQVDISHIVGAKSNRMEWNAYAMHIDTNVERKYWLNRTSKIFLLMYSTYMRAECSVGFSPAAFHASSVWVLIRFGVFGVFPLRITMFPYRIYESIIELYPCTLFVEWQTNKTKTYMARQQYGAKRKEASIQNAFTTGNILMLWTSFWDLNCIIKLLSAFSCVVLFNPGAPFSFDFAGCVSHEISRFPNYSFRWYWTQLIAEIFIMHTFTVPTPTVLWHGSDVFMCVCMRRNVE